MNEYYSEGSFRKLNEILCILSTSHPNFLSGVAETLQAMHDAAHSDTKEIGQAIDICTGSVANRLGQKLDDCITLTSRVSELLEKRIELQQKQLDQAIAQNLLLSAIAAEHGITSDDLTKLEVTELMKEASPQ